MPSFKVAHLHEQGQDMVIIPLESSFGTKSSDEQQSVMSELQMRSQSAGLKGTVVPVWNAGGGRMGFIAPHQWRPFFQGMSMQTVSANLNKTLSW